MFGIGATEMVIIGIVLLIAVGPTKLPKLLKAVVKGYREFRNATRELRASTGIDEILRDEELKDLRKPFNDILAEEPGQKGKPAAKKRSLSYTERVQENPPEGVDLAEIREEENRPSEEERDAIVAAKNASIVDDEAIRQAKIAATAPQEPEEDDRIRQAKIDAKNAAVEPQSPEEDERVRQAKIDAKISAARESEDETDEEPAEEPAEADDVS